METIKKINKILNINQKRNFYLLMLVTAFVSFLDLIGIGALVPVLIIFAEENIASNKYMETILEKFSFLTEDNILFFSLFFLLFIFLFKILSSLILNVIKYKILFSFYRRISTRLMSIYLNLSYSEFINLKIFEKTNIVKTEVEYFILGVIDPFLVIFLEVLTIIFIFIFLIYYDPSISIKIIFVISLPLLLMMYFFGKKMKKLGAKRHELNNQLQLQITQGLHGIKDIKLSSKEKNLLKKFDASTFNLSKTQSIIFAWQSIPRHILEIITIIAFIFIVLIGINNNQQFSELVVILGLFAAATFRIMPSLNRIVVSFNSIRQSKKVIDVIYQDANRLKISNDNNYINSENKNYPLKDINKIQIENLYFKYENSDNFVIEDLNLIINKGDYIGIFGKSGSGKTTFVDLFSGLLKANSGTIKFDDKNVDANEEKWKRSISYVPQFTFLNNESIRENVAFGESSEKIDDKKVIKSLEHSQLLEFVNSLPDGISTTIGENGKNLSGGQIQRLGIARALYKDCKILIFDESTNSLDNETEKLFMETVNQIKKDRIVFFITHKVSILDNCDFVYKLENSKLNKIK